MVRRFNRFYTREIGLLRRTFLDTPWTLGEMRVLFEIAQQRTTATEIARQLDLDMAHLSRVLSKLQKQKLVARKPCPQDARQYRLELTASGRTAFDRANEQQAALTEAALRNLSPAQRQQLCAAMTTIENLLSPGRETHESSTR